MKKKSMISLLFILLIIFISDCSSDDAKADDKQKKSKKAAKEEQAIKDFNHEIGETFEVKDGITKTPLDITVKKIWMEDGNKHKEYIKDVEDDDTVTFINYTVKNKGDDTVTLADAIPKYFGTGASSDEIDLSYPKNDLAKEYYDGFKVEIEPGETLDLTGSTRTSIYSENNGAFIWEFLQDIPEVVFQTPLSERRDAPGIYELGKPIYVVDETEDHQLLATINDVTTKDETKFKNNFDNGEWIVIDMDIENKGKEDKSVTYAFPTAVMDDEELFHDNEFELDGEVIDNLHEDEEAIIKSGEKVTGTLYINVQKTKLKKHNFIILTAHF